MLFVKKSNSRSFIKHYFKFSELCFIFCLGQPNSIKKHFPGYYIQRGGKFKDFSRTHTEIRTFLRTFQGKLEFKDFSRTSRKIQGHFKTVPTLG